MKQDCLVCVDVNAGYYGGFASKVREKRDNLVHRLKKWHVTVARHLRGGIERFGRVSVTRVFVHSQSAELCPLQLVAVPDPSVLCSHAHLTRKGFLDRWPLPRLHQCFIILTKRAEMSWHMTYTLCWSIVIGLCPYPSCQRLSVWSDVEHDAQNINLHLMKWLGMVFITVNMKSTI